MGKKPVMTAEFEDERVGVTFIHWTTGLKTDMAEDDSTVHHPGKPLEAIVDPAGQIGLFRRLFNESIIFLEVSYAPAIHVLAALFDKKG